MSSDLQQLPSRFLSLQYLRGLAAILIVLYHVEIGVQDYLSLGFSFSLFHWGSAAVPLFFVLSGFVVALAGFQRPRPAARFLYARLARLYPTYLLIAALFITLLAVLPPSLFRSQAPITLERIVRALFFEFGQITGYVYVGWVLFYELLFYLVFSLVIARFAHISSTGWFHALMFAGLLMAAFMGFAISGYFLTGVVAFLLIQNPGRWPWWSWPPWRLMLIIGLVLNGLRTPLSLVCFVLVTGLVLLESGRVGRNPFARPWGFPLVVGDASYPIYLAQLLTVSSSLKLGRLVIDRLTPFIPSGFHFFLYWLIAVSLSLVTTIAAGLLLRRYFEEPAYRRLMRFLPASRGS
jgi:peptidoglycan/LPS O-acetylase OafA/YrhL